MLDGCCGEPRKEKYIRVKEPTECNLCAESVFNIIKKGREAGSIKIGGLYKYPSCGGLRGNKKGLVDVSEYIVHISSKLVCKIFIGVHGYIERIRIADCQYEFNEKTDTTILLASTILGYFQDKDKEACLRAEQQKQKEQEQQETEYRRKTDKVRRYLADLYNGM